MKRQFSLILILSLILSCMPAAFAEQSNLYTVEKAKELAVKSIDQLESNAIEKVNASKRIDNLISNINDIALFAQNESGRKDTEAPLLNSVDALRNGLDAMSDNEELVREATRDMVESIFLTIHKSEIQMQGLDDQIAFSEKMMSIDRMRLKQGLISKFDLEKNDNALKKMIRQRNALKMNVDKLYISLKELMNVNSKAVIALDFSFISQHAIVPVTKASYEHKLLDKNLKIAMLEKSVARAASSSSIAKERNGKSDDGLKLDESKAELSLKLAKEALPYQFETAFTNLVDAYDYYQIKGKDLSLKKIELKNAELRFKLGNGSKMELDNQKLAVKTAERDVQMAQIDYVSAEEGLNSVLRGTGK